jgi:hypothetical protein
MNRRFATLTLTALACATVASAQTSSTSGGVRGVIKDKAGKAIANATVVLRNRETGLTRTTTSDAAGEYRIGLLPVGNYELTVTASGSRTVKDASLQVLLGQSTGANFSLDKAEASATVEVAANAETLDTTQVNSVVAIDTNLVENVPLKGRNFTDLMKLTPGAVTGVTGRQVVEGSRGIMNNLTIDGASFNSSFYGDPRGGTAIPFAFGLDTVKEMQIITDAYDPQYAGSGAVINAVSKQGGNEFSGDVLDQFRSQNLVAKMRPVPYDPRGTTNTDASRTLAFSQQQLSANVGGAIIKDKLFYFVGAEQLHYSQNLTPAFAVASSGNNSDTNLKAFITNFGGIGVGGGRSLASESGLPITNDQKNLTFFGRLDWIINENHRASLRLNTQQFTNTNGTNLGVTTGLSDNGVDKVSSISWVAELVSSFGANMTNEARLQVADERHPRVANSSIPELTVGGGFTSGQIWYAPSQLNEFNNQVLDTLTWSEGDWLVKGGVDLQWFSFQNQFPQYMGGFYSFPDYATANRWAAGTLTASDTSVKYQGAVSPTNGWINYNSSLFAGFLQAQYRGFLDKRLTLTGGIRVTRENEPNNPLPNAQFAGTDQADSNTSYDPRFGFSLDLFGDGKTVLKGGWGAFTSPDPSLTVSNTMTANGNTISVYSITPGSALAAWNGGVLSYANRTQGGTTLLPLDTATLTTIGGLGARTGQLWDPNNKMPRKIASTLGLEHKYDNGLVLGARGEYSVFQHQQYFINVNLPQLNADGTPASGAYYNDGYPTNVNLFSKVAANRPGFAIIRGRNVSFNGFGNVYLSENNGTGSYKAMTFTAARTSDTGFGFQSSVTWSKAMDMNSNERITNGGVSVTNNPADPSANLAPSDSDARFRGVFTGYFPVLFGVQGAVTFQYQSGLPYSAVAGGTLGDLNGDGLTNDYAPGYGGRNGQRQPSQKFLDLAFKRTWSVTKKFQIEGGIQIFNLFNWANQTTGQTQATNVTGTYPNALVSAPVASFGFIDTLDRNPREVQFSLRLKF